jgi:hypothetical protein
VVAAPIITANGSTSICDGATVMLTASNGGLGYVWMPTATAASSINVTTSGCYTVVTVDASGCSATSAPMCITVNSVPAAPTISMGTDGSLTASTTAPAYVWANNGSIVSGNTQTIFPSNNGLYNVVAVSVDGCVSDTSATFNYIYTNVTNNGTQEFVSVYPNPATDKIIIKAQFENALQMQVTLQDIAGRNIEVIDGNVAKTMLTEINISNQPAGVYFINFKNGNNTITKKIVKQ